MNSAMAGQLQYSSIMVTWSDLKASKVAVYFFFVKCSRIKAFRDKEKRPGSST